jgi:hypothetical protein
MVRQGLGFGFRVTSWGRWMVCLFSNSGLTSAPVPGCARKLRFARSTARACCTW